MVSSKVNKTGLQPVSRPVEKIIGFCWKVTFSKKKRRKLGWIEGKKQATERFKGIFTYALILNKI